MNYSQDHDFILVTSTHRIRKKRKKKKKHLFMHVTFFTTYAIKYILAFGIVQKETLNSLLYL